jgi:hypothetical protein
VLYASVVAGAVDVVLATLVAGPVEATGSVDAIVAGIVVASVVGSVDGIVSGGMAATVVAAPGCVSACVVAGPLAGICAATIPVNVTTSAMRAADFTTSPQLLLQRASRPLQAAGTTTRR